MITQQNKDLLHLVFCNMRVSLPKHLVSQAKTFAIQDFFKSLIYELCPQLKSTIPELSISIERCAQPNRKHTSKVSICVCKSFLQCQGILLIKIKQENEGGMEIIDELNEENSFDKSETIFSKLWDQNKKLIRETIVTFTSAYTLLQKFQYGEIHCPYQGCRKVSK